MILDGNKLKKYTLLFAILKTVYIVYRKSIQFIQKSIEFKRIERRIHSSFLSLFCTNKQDFIIKIDKPLVLISQIQRSGGSLLSQLFDGHSECYVHPAEITVGKPKYIWPTVDIKLPCRMIFSSLRENNIDRDLIYGYRKNGVGKNKGERYPFLFNKQHHKNIFKKLFLQKKPVTGREVLNYYFTAYFNAWFDYQNLYSQKNKKYVVGFTPRVNMNHQGSVDRLFIDYPDGYLISLVRNPISWYASAKKHSDEYRNIEKSMELWVESTLTTLQLKDKYPEQIIIINFEELVSDTKKTMQAIADKLDLGFEEILFSPTFNTIAIESDSSFESKKGIDISTIDRSFHLSNEEIKYIEANCVRFYNESIKNSIND